jgi:hypothetical protein
MVEAGLVEGYGAPSSGFLARELRIRLEGDAGRSWLTR